MPTLWEGAGGWSFFLRPLPAALGSWGTSGLFCPPLCPWLGGWGAFAVNFLQEFE